MIHRTVPTLQVKSWQEELQQLIQCPKTLIHHLELDKNLINSAIAANALFPLKITESYLSKIKKGDPKDPLLQQVLPIGAELRPHPEYSDDPLHERDFQPVPGVIHKYDSRVLFIAATQCAIHCRYCFRRHFPYNENRLNRDQWLKALEYISNTPSLNEVILSGGDPLSLSDKQLSWLIEQISAIPHIIRVRIHTRYPIILPSRISSHLIRALTSTPLKTIIVIHCNHPQEIDSRTLKALAHLKKADITLLNQSVLLKGINDSCDTLSTLSEALFDAGVMPYYLHLLDKVSGTSHFEVEYEQAKVLYKELLACLPGYLTPKLVKELANEKSKTMINI